MKIVLSSFIWVLIKVSFLYLQAHYSASNYAEHIKVALDKLHQEVPKAFVNLVNIFDIAPIAGMDGGFICSIAHQYVNIAYICTVHIMLVTKNTLTPSLVTYAFT